MTGEFTHITRCAELDESDVAAAVAARDAARALLVRLATIASPDSGATRVLLLFARMATAACDWVNGSLCVDLAGDADMTLVEASTELGGGLRERVFAPMPFRAPLTEFARAIESGSALIAPLTVRAQSAKRITLSAPDVAPVTSRPVPLGPVAPEGPGTDDVDAGWGS